MKFKMGRDTCFSISLTALETLRKLGRGLWGKTNGHGESIRESFLYCLVRQRTCDEPSYGPKVLKGHTPTPQLCTKLYGNNISL
ncbi:hypothetical protein VNO77_01415 [Canavalia gladiata]|uniref:Uncharacterized protein n=1 Tax=Canavalia gladiata TaxID=3824 RepID=A0AAN9MR37_CANGL